MSKQPRGINAVKAWLEYGSCRERITTKEFAEFWTGCSDEDKAAFKTVAEEELSKVWGVV